MKCVVVDIIITMYKLIIDFFPPLSRSTSYVGVYYLCQCGTICSIV